MRRPPRLHAVGRTSGRSRRPLRREPVLSAHPWTHGLVDQDAAVLLAELFRSRRLGEPASLLKPFAAPTVCSACDDAYQLARFILAQAGGVEAWLRNLEIRARHAARPLTSTGRLEVLSPHMGRKILQASVSELRLRTKGT
jgi:hypothetical protein